MPRNSDQASIEYALRIRRITGKAWDIAQKVLEDENYDDPAFKKALILKIVGGSVPKDINVGGQENGAPILIELAKEVALKNNLNVPPSGPSSDSPIN